MVIANRKFDLFRMTKEIVNHSIREIASKKKNRIAKFLRSSRAASVVGFFRNGNSQSLTIRLTIRAS